MTGCSCREGRLCFSFSLRRPLCAGCNRHHEVSSKIKVSAIRYPYAELLCTRGTN